MRTKSQSENLKEKRQEGRPQHGWEDNIKMGFKK